MRRKSERTASKKAKPSPEKKIETPKRTRSRRSKKPSTSSENDSPDEGSPVREPVVVESEVKPPTTPAKEASPEDAPDQVWQVKSAQSTSETGEIQKLKICLTRPPSTPERVERSPRSRRKHARATSSSDTPSGDGSEEKKKRHRSRRSTRESNDDGSEKNHESQSDEPEKEQIRSQKEDTVKLHEDAAHSTQPLPQSDDTPMSTTTEENKCVTAESTEKEAITTKVDDGGEEKDKSSNADTTVASPKQVEDKQADNVTSESQANSQSKDSSPVQIMEVEIEKSSASENQSKEHTPEAKNKEPQNDSRMEEDATEDKVSKVKELIESEQVPEISQGKDNKATNENDVVEKQSSRPRSLSADSNKDADETHKMPRSRVLEQTDSIQTTPADPTSNGQATPTPIVINRKRRWGSRTSKLTTQKSITISTDVLKDIIPDVKPVEFEEVIEEKKHKRVDMNDRIERPILPKIIIDNTENVEKRDQEDKENVKSKDILPMSNRKISIVRDNDDIITRPPSPPRHKQSRILYITNLVRPFTLPQLKNLLQRTGRIAEDGFWIDRIKSRCFVIYENEDQAVETRHALHGVTWPVSNPKALQVDFSSQEAFDKAKANEDTENTQSNTIPGTVEDWLREQDMKRDHGDLEKPWERKTIVREWDVGKGDKPKDEKMINRDVRSLDNRRHRTPERSPEPAKKFKKKEEEAPAKLLDDLFRKTKTTPCIYWLPLSAETISVKEEQRRQHMAEHERRLHELRRHRRH